MSSMDLEKLKMTGAGRALAVLTSGGDAQGDLKHSLGGFKILLAACAELWLRNTDQQRGEGLFTDRWVHFF